MIEFLITIISVLIGYWIGRSAKPEEDMKQGLSQLQNNINGALKYNKYRNRPSQIIQRPDAKRLHVLNNPEIEEETEEMKRQLDEGIQPLTP